MSLWMVITTVTQWAYEKCAAIWRGLRTTRPQLQYGESTATAAAAIRAEQALAGYLGSLLRAGDGATVTLVAGQTRLLAHTAVLATRSHWFAYALKQNSGELSLPDVEGPVLRQLLAFCYTLRAPQLPSMAAQLVAAADKYGVPRLKAHCERHLAAQLTVENAAATAVLALKHSCRNLKTAAVIFIRAHNYQVMATQGWADAVRNEPEEVIRLSLHLDGALPDPRIYPEEDRSKWLLRAAEYGEVDEVRLLLAAGVDVESREQGEDGEDYTPLHWAALKGQLEVVQVLLEAGARVNSRGLDDGDTPLHVAAFYNQAAVVGMLAAASADLNARNRWGETPLHIAIEKDHKEVVAALLEAGVEGGAESQYGVTPLDHTEMPTADS